MIAYLKGIPISKSADSLILDVNGVGYEIFMPASSLEKLAIQSDALSLIIYTAVREDNISLFGFGTPQEKQLFLRLLSVSGIGPKLAMQILSGIAPDELILAIAKGDLLRLTAISGIGKKTAERMVVELKDKLLLLTGKIPNLQEPSPAKHFTDDVLSALLNLGYNRNEVERVLNRLSMKEDSPFEEILKEALQLLSKT